MKILAVSILVLGALTYVSAQGVSFGKVAETDPNLAQAQSFQNLLNRLLSVGLPSFTRHINLKLRVFRFILSISTPENLVLLRDLLEHSMKITNLIIRILPASVEERGNLIVGLSQMVGAANGQVGEGLLQLVLGQFQSNFNVSAPYTETDPDVYNDTDNDTDVTRSSRSVSPKDVLTTYEDRINSLDKLINANRK